MTLLECIEEAEARAAGDKAAQRAYREAVERTYREKAEAWVEEYPQVYALFEKFALQLAERKRHFGMKQIAERVRFEVALTWEKDEDGFRVNNNYISYIGRMIAEKHPQIKEFVEFRRAQGD
jgi:hypothetical protein